MYKTDINSINDLLQVVEYLDNNNPDRRCFTKSCDGPPWYKYNHNLWFRGQGDYNWELKPQVERENFYLVAKKALSLPLSYETSILNQLNIHASHLFQKNLTNTERYFLAQHHGFPTRLLDWTINPLVALFFTVSYEKEKDGSFYCFYSRGEIIDHESDDVITQKNKTVISFINKLFKRTIENQNESNANYPLRIVPNSQEGRIIQQGSRFTLHFPGGHSLDKQIGQVLFKYKIPKINKAKILKELRLLGINWGSLFPDIDHMVKEIKSQANLS